jgi:hypothetical protein
MIAVDQMIGKRDQSMIGNGYATGVTAQIAEHILGTSEGSFRVDHPSKPEQYAYLNGS